MKKYVMLSGLRKSGTSVTKALLDNHPMLGVIPPNEFDLFAYTKGKNLAQVKYSEIADLTELSKKLSNQDFVQRMKSDNSNLLLQDLTQNDSRESFDVDMYEELVNREYKNLDELFQNHLDSFLKASNQENKPYCVFKNTLETEHFDLYNKMLNGNLKLIYIIRNPYAQFVAQTRGEYIPGKKFVYPLLSPFINKMKYEYYFIEKWRFLFPNDVLVVRYEDVITSTKVTMKSIAEFLGVEYHESMERPTILGEHWGGNSSHKGFVFKGLDERPIQQWKEKINRNEKALITKYFKDEIINYGYEVEEGKSSVLPFHKSESLKRYIGNKFIAFAPYY